MWFGGGLEGRALVGDTADVAGMVSLIDWVIWGLGEYNWVLLLL